MCSVKPGWERTPTSRLVTTLRNIADAGGSLSPGRIRILIESADRLEELDERVAIMAEGNRKTDVTGIDFSGEVRDR